MLLAGTTGAGFANRNLQILIVLVHLQFSCTEAASPVSCIYLTAADVKD